MHHQFYLNNELTDIEKINKLFPDGEQIKNYLKENNLKCGYHLECQAKLVSAFLNKNNLVYLRSKNKSDHLSNCPFHDLVRLKQKLMTNRTLDFLIKGLPKRTVNKDYSEFNKLINSKYTGIYLKLAELFDLLKNDSDLKFLKETSFINPEYCEEWYKNSHMIENNAVLLTGILSRKFYSCLKSNKECKWRYDCKLGHKPKDYKIEIVEKDIEFHISVSKEIYDSVYYASNKKSVFVSEKPKTYHVLAKINEMKKSNLENKRFYTKHNKKINHIVKNKRFVELIEEI